MMTLTDPVQMFATTEPDMTRHDAVPCGSASHGFRRTVLAAILSVVFAGACRVAGGRASLVAAQQGEPGQLPKPFLLVEGEFDRNCVSDLYAFEMDGTLIKRLTSEPLPTNHLVAVAPGRGDPFFVANASAFYSLSLRHNVLTSVHSANVRVAAVSPDGSMTAFVIAPEAPPGIETAAPSGVRAGDSAAAPLIVRVMPVLAGSRWRPTQFALPAGVVPSEMTFAPDGDHVLITHWPGDRTAQLLLVDLRSGGTQTVLADEGASYHEPVFAPDGKALLAVREDLGAGRWSIVSLAWPVGNAPAVILTGPNGVSLSTPIFLADGTRFLFHQESALARATLDGKTVDALVGTLDTKDRDWHSILDICRARPARAGWLPSVVNRYFARVEYREREDQAADPLADVIVIDVQTAQRTTIPMPAGLVRAAVVVE
ncbi:MAG: hypothetical protein ABL998_04110 [Planctomycetota bacterium]